MIVLSFKVGGDLPGGACAEVDCHNVGVLRVLFQECHLNLNLMIVAEKESD